MREEAQMGNDQDKRISPNEFYRLAVKTISCLADEVTNSFLADFPDGEALPMCVLQPTLLPIVNSINSVGVATEQTLELVEAIKNNCNFQAWRQPYSIEDFGEEFFSQSAWFPIADLQGPLVYSGGLMEIMFLNSQLAYPKHRHSPEELYIVLAGKVWWEADDSDEPEADDADDANGNTQEAAS